MGSGTSSGKAAAVGISQQDLDYIVSQSETLSQKNRRWPPNKKVTARMEKIIDGMKPGDKVEAVDTMPQNIGGENLAEQTLVWTKNQDGSFTVDQTIRRYKRSEGPGSATVSTMRSRARDTEAAAASISRHAFQNEGSVKWRTRR